MVFETLLRRNSTCSVNLNVELTTTPSTVSQFSLVMVVVGGGRFSTSSCRFATRFPPAFDFFVENLQVANPLHQSRHVETDAAG